MLVHTCNPKTVGLKQEAGLGYTVGILVSKKKKKKKEQK